MVELTQNSAAPAPKAAYAAPVLTVFGSVRELTGGTSTIGTADGGSGMSMT